MISTGRTVADVMRDSLARKSGQATVTSDGYEDRAAHIIRHLGATPLSKLTGQRIADFYVALETQNQPPRNKPLRPKTIGHIIGVLNRALDLAVARGELRGNPIRLEKIRGPRKRKRMLDIFSAAEVEQLLHGAATMTPDVPWLPSAIALMARCALRPGEAMALKRNDFSGSSLRIERSIATLETPKTDFGYRVIVIDETVRDLVEGWLSVNPDTTWVFPSSVGIPTKIQVLGKVFNRLLQGLKMRHHVPYDLRHTAITHAMAYARVADGVSLADVARWAGHSRTSTTLDNYTHLLPINAGMVVTMARAYRTELLHIVEAKSEGEQPGEVEDRRLLAAAV